MKQKDMQVKRIVVIDSLHCGSIYGLHPPNFKASSDASVPQNPGQKYLWDCWKDFITWATQKPTTAVVVLGDIIDGDQRRQGGTEKCLATLGDQIEAAVQSLFWFGGAPFYLVQGTEYHDESAGRAVDEIATRVGARRYVGLGAGYRTHEVLDLKIDGTTINFAHHGPGCVGLYRATGADKEGIFSALAGKEGKAPRADVVVRGHWHFFIHVEHESKHIVYVPCWQLQTRYMRHNSVYRMIPDIGGIVIEVDPAKIAEGEDPVTIVKRIYALPKREVEKV